MPKVKKSNFKKLELVKPTLFIDIRPMSQTRNLWEYLLVNLDGETWRLGGNVPERIATKQAMKFQKFSELPIYKRGNRLQSEGVKQTSD